MRTLLTVLLGVLVCSTSNAALIGVELTSGNLYNVSSVNASLTLVGHTDVTQPWGDIAWSPDGKLYGYTLPDNGYNPIPAKLYRIDYRTANCTLVGDINKYNVEGGLAFGPDGTLYGVQFPTGSGDGLVRIDTATGAMTPIAPVQYRSNLGYSDISAIAWRRDGLLVGVHSRSNSLITINPVTGETSLVATLSPYVGAVSGITISDGVGYIATGNFWSIHPTSPYFNGSNELWQFDPFTGAHSLVGSFAPTISGQASGIVGLALPEPGGISLVIAPFVLSRRSGNKRDRRLQN
jgi:hypothetical protein